MGYLSWRNIAKTLVLGTVLSLSSNLSASLLGSDQFGNLFSINTATGAGMLIGTETNFPLSTEIEFNPLTGTLYSEEVNGFTGLHTLNPATGLSTGFIGHGCCALNGMEFVGNTLYVTNVMGGGGGTPSTLETLNTTTGVLSPIGLTGVTNITGLAYDVNSGIMYGSWTSGNLPTILVTVNLMTGMAMPVAPLFDIATGAPLDRVGSIEFDNGILYGGMGLNATFNPGWLFSINTMTGASTMIGPTGFAITGLTDISVPTGVPAPLSLALFALGLLVMGARRRHPL